MSLAMANWAEEMSEAGRAELEEDCRLCEEEEARGEYEAPTAETIGAWFEGIKAEGRAMLTAERKKAS